MTSDERAAAIVRSTLQLSRVLGMTMVVEGGEVAATVEALRDWGCEYAQGYVIARPMTGDDIIGWLQSRRRSALRAVRA